MQYIHITNLDEYNPHYKDRNMIWFKFYFKMVQGDPEFELIESEIDKWRYVSLIALELQSKKPIPISDAFFRRKGFNLRKRSMSLTIKMLHSFITIVTEDSKVRTLYKEEEDKDKEKINILFDEFWNLYDKKVGKAISIKLWNKLSNHERTLIMEYVPKYVSIREKSKRRDPERFFTKRVWEDELIENKPTDNRGTRRQGVELTKEQKEVYR